MKKFILINFKGKISGLGHSNRCKILAKYLKNQKKINITHKEFNDIGIIEGFTNDLLKKFLLQTINNKYDGLILDISSKSIIDSYPNLKIILNSLLNSYLGKIILINSIKKEKLVIKKNHTSIIPYYIKDLYFSKSGFEYVICDPRLYLIKKFKQSNGENLLITFGGADICSIELVLKFLKKKYFLLKSHNIRLIVGKHCDHRFKKYVRKSLIDFDRVKIFDNLKSNYNNFKWSDKVITSDGTSKYECIASGKKAIILSTSNTNFRYSKSFNSLNIFKVIPFKHNETKKISMLTNFVLDDSEFDYKKLNIYRFKMKNALLNYSNLLNKIN